MDFVTDKLFPSLLGRQWHEGFCGEFDPVLFLAQKKVLIDRQMESDLIMFIILEKGCFVFSFDLMKISCSVKPGQVYLLTWYYSYRIYGINCPALFVQIFFQPLKNAWRLRLVRVLLEYLRVLLGEWCNTLESWALAVVSFCHSS